MLVVLVVGVAEVVQRLDGDGARGGGLRLRGSLGGGRHVARSLIRDRD